MYLLVIEKISKSKDILWSLRNPLSTAVVLTTAKACIISSIRDPNWSANNGIEIDTNDWSKDHNPNHKSELSYTENISAS